MKTELIELKNNITIPVTENTQFIALPSEDLASLELVFEKENVSAELIIPYRAGKGKSVNFRTSCIHRVPNTSCTTRIRGVLEDDSVSDFVGKIIIDKSAVNTKAYLQDNVLVAGSHTKNTSSPILKIDNNEVKAGHGATTGRVNKETVYYLMSRGLSEKEAEEIIISGFFEKLLNTINDDKLKERVRLTL